MPAPAEEKEAIVSRGPGDIVALRTGTTSDPELTLHRPTRDTAARTSLGDGWRHDYDIVLTADGPSRVVHDERGRRHVFDPSVGDRPTASGDARKPARHRALDRSSGRLLSTAAGHVWHRMDGTRVTFAGSVPVRFRRHDGSVHRLHYRAGTLRKVDRSDRSALRFEYDSGALVAVSLADGTRWRLTRDVDGAPLIRRDDRAEECLPSDEHPLAGPRDDVSDGGTGDPADAGTESVVPDEEHRCDVDGTPSDERASRGASIPDALEIEARPGACRSYFSEHVGTERGAAIERGLAGLAHYAGYEHAVRSFPVADFIGEELRVVRSRDLTLPAYATRPDGLLERLLADGEIVVRRLLEPLERDGRITLTELGRTTTLRPRADRPVVLELVVRHGLASADQVRQIASARRLLRERHGIALRVIEIP